MNMPSVPWGLTSRGGGGLSTSALLLCSSGGGGGWGASVEKVTRWPRGRPGDFIFLSKGAGSPSFCRALKLEQDPGGQLPCAVCPAHFCAHRALGKDLSDE